MNILERVIFSEYIRMVANEKLDKVIDILNVHETAVGLAQKVRPEYGRDVARVHFVGGRVRGHLAQKPDQIVQEKVVVLGQFGTEQVLGHVDLVAHGQHLDGHHLVEDAIAEQ